MKTLFKLGIKAIGLCVSLASAQPAFSSDFMVHTAVLPPFINAPESETAGIAIDLITELAQRTGLDLTVEYVPWPRAMKMTETAPNTFLAPPVRSPGREDKFHWVVELVPSNQVFMTTGAQIKSFDEARSLGKIAVVRDSAMENILTKQGFTNLHLVPSPVQAAKLVKAGRADAWYAVDVEVHGVFAEAGIQPGELIAGESVLNAHHWLAVNLDFDADMVGALTAAMEEMHADGTYDAIIAKYIH